MTTTMTKAIMSKASQTLILVVPKLEILVSFSWRDIMIILYSLFRFNILLLLSYPFYGLDLVIMSKNKMDLGEIS